MTELETLEYELLLMRRMVEQLPKATSDLLITQLEKIIAAMIARDKAFNRNLVTHVDDIILATKVTEFDLFATKQEKKALQERLDRLSNGE